MKEKLRAKISRKLPMLTDQKYMKHFLSKNILAYKIIDG